MSSEIVMYQSEDGLIKIETTFAELKAEQISYSYRIKEDDWQ